MQRRDRPWGGGRAQAVRFVISMIKPERYRLGANTLVPFELRVFKSLLVRDKGDEVLFVRSLWKNALQLFDCWV